MNRGRRVRFLAVAVLALAALLIVMSRQIGRGGPGSDRAQRRGHADRGATPTEQAATGAAGLPDLSFYDTLGVTSGGAGRAAAPPSGPRLKGAAEKPAPADAYVIQVLATHDAAQARQVREQVAALGIPARVIEGEAEGKPIYRVRVGSYRERKTAVAWAEKIEARIGLTPWVLQEARQ
ncbi:MAG TPA: SPOR domain-containing protein [Candidatus Polarisedimenticolia bacterium]|nr:SPOR domain-containing protein [Candidatus Polarisedimenticolia bacterium]